MSNSYGWASPANSGRVAYPMDAPQTAMVNPLQQQSLFNTQPVRQRDSQPGDYGGTVVNPISYAPSNQGNSLLGTWRDKYGNLDFSKTNEADIAERYGETFAIPYFNAAMAERTQGWNEAQGMANFGEQQRLNTSQIGLAERSAGREDTALNFGMETNRRDFGETQRQFDVSSGQNQYGLSTQRTQVNNQNAISQEQNRIAQYEASTGRIDVEGRQRLEQFANDTARMNVQNQYNLGNYANQTDRAAQEATASYQKNQIGVAQEQNRIDQMYKSGLISNEQYNNETNRLNANNQYSLGQGQLGFQNRELDVNDAYRRQALSQEDRLTQQRLQNEMTQSRYSAFGRAAQPSFRAAQSWY